ncbi:MAG: MmcQ/YjbR family DNA-binding protein [Bacteroidia bacterium]|nr:MmcQ/YjbR family DNA-binding protein [Bacteroidia bacterium]NNF31698.1 MmcQ/YjbR family DNA-binding protein [Flavobacteriaceae bacterium]NNJ81557.1 MmcQ/YjbR family DNA-binding protein [Flavobacteriaceae bacterium]NNK55212.1 MmcQ/YjbR family DNA-binding protein [Flavobacteriaceae bacterium]NNM10207.1 MmcQ/YjbR family DNA-binding protein [Flavobacteriaceae bacterium]
MNIEEFRDYCLSKKGVTESFPFDEHTLVFKVMGKMFALTGLERIPKQVNLKCDPERSVRLREEYDGLIYGAYHMSKVLWNTVEIESNVPRDLIYELIDHSYELVVDGLTKKLKEELRNL